MLRIHLFSFVVVSVGFALVCGELQKPTPKAESQLRSIGEMRYERAVHTATRLTDGSVLIVGGMRVNGEFHDTAESFDLAKGGFTVLPGRMTKKRVAHTATLLKDGRVLIAGGWSNTTAPENSAEIFDPKRGKFLPASDMAMRRSGHSATLLPDGRVLIAGGHDGDRILDSLELFDPKTGGFSKAGNLSVPRKIHTATTISAQKILFTGGEVAENRVDSSAEVFDVSKGSSTKLNAEMGTPRYKHDAVRLKDGRVLIFGGSDERDRSGRLKTAEVFDPSTGSFKGVGDMNFPRFKINGAAVLLKDGKVLIAGGAEKAEIFDPAQGTFETVAGDFGSRFHFASATILDDGSALVTGGYKFRRNASPLATSGAWLYEN